METVMRALGFVLLLAMPFALSGCFPAVVAVGSETAAVVAQERSVGNAVDDTGILLQIKNSFAGKDFKGLFANVEVKVVEGRVLLTGNVDKPESQVEAVRLTWEVSGVVEVIDEIQVNDKSSFWNYTRDVWISTQIRARLLATKGIRSVNFSVLTVNQVVYIMGIAQNQMELDKVTYIASTTSYVQRVVSYARFKDDPRRKG
ncbi:MAG: BON domain-containing protein [Alphaproteobacteria bacterium]|nr:BON domain-containing protein [Alphaproteobacteria bacterium]